MERESDGGRGGEGDSTASSMGETNEERREREREDDANDIVHYENDDALSQNRETNHARHFNDASFTTLLNVDGHDLVISRVTVPPAFTWQMIRKGLSVFFTRMTHDDITSQRPVLPFGRPSLSLSLSLLSSVPSFHSVCDPR